MIELTVDIKGADSIAALLSGVRSQVPFAAALAINNTLNDAQAAIRKTLPEHFTLRRKEFIERTIYIGAVDRAKKDNLVGVVRVNPERNQLAKFELGGEKKSVTSKSLAVPVFREADRSRLITRGDPMALKKLFQVINQRGGRLRARRKKGEPPPPVMVGGDVFLFTGRDGRHYIAQRGFVSYGPQLPDRMGNRSNIHILYAFDKRVPIPGDLNFDATALAATLRHWQKNADEALARAIATAR